MNTMTTVSAKTTKTCTKCHVEKTLDEFHRRGHIHQNICKTCRLASAKLPHTKRTQRKDNSNNYSAIGERIAELEPRLRLIARSYAGDPHEAEDVFQFICEKLLQQISPDDSDSRILTTAKRRAGDFLNAEKTYSFMVGDESEINGTGSDEEEMDTFEMYIGDRRSAEDMAIENEQLAAINAAIAKLDEKNQKIITMLSEGYNQSEIAIEFCVTRSAINSRMKTIQIALDTLGILPS
jgi:RNA polymerase sigma factor (sigma-70 family)